MMQSLPNQMMTQENNPTNSVEATLRQELTKLDVKRKNMEHEADAILLELTTPPEEGVEPMGMDTPLVDQDGYPRGDIDIYRTRTMRRRFRTLKTDHKEISSEIENMLLQLSAMKVRTLLSLAIICVYYFILTFFCLPIPSFRIPQKKQKTKKRSKLENFPNPSPNMILSLESGS